ncbi:hypothetical protein [Thermodesulfovibrio yellowstonii]|uniref:hypothetical protein n=1 Tax=Thermodesulfovibrio yellowstonii TaxID=28262 RepID=UPI003C7A0062
MFEEYIFKRYKSLLWRLRKNSSSLRLGEGKLKEVNMKIRNLTKKQKQELIKTGRTIVSYDQVQGVHPDLAYSLFNDSGITWALKKNQKGFLLKVIAGNII